MPDHQEVHPDEANRKKMGRPEKMPDHQNEVHPDEANRTKKKKSFNHPLHGSQIRFQTSALQSMQQFSP